jgi:opacity protein-like surface antigen
MEQSVGIFFELNSIIRARAQNTKGKKMKISMKSVALAAIMAMTSAQVLAQVYGEVGYQATTIKTTVAGNNVKSSPGAVVGYLGYDLNDNLALEGSLTLGVGSADTTVNGASQSNPVSTKIDHGYGVYLKPKVRINESVEVFGRLGYTQGKSTSSTATVSSSETKSDWAYGLGMSYALSTKTYLTATWMRLYDKDSTKSNGLTVGVGYRF